MKPPREFNVRKLLVATVGLAAVSYVGCTEESPVANLMAPPPTGNLVPPPDASVDMKADMTPPLPPPTGNLVPPPPMDGGDARDGGDGSADGSGDGSGDGATDRMDLGDAVKADGKE
jgi:hypothetical protein